MRRGFKQEAKRLALEVRAELDLDAFVWFDPFALAKEYGVPVYGLSDLARDDQAREAASHYNSGRSSTFSAALVPAGTGMFILDNDSHALVRRRNSINESPPPVPADMGPGVCHHSTR